MPTDELFNRLLGPTSPASRVALSVLDTVDLANCSIAEIEAVIFRAVDEVNTQCPAAEDRAVGRATIAGWARVAEAQISLGTVRGVD